MDVDELVAEGDVVAARITARGTHLGELVRAGFTLVAPRAQGQRVTLAATIWFRIADGRIVELHETGDF